MAREENILYSMGLDSREFDDAAKRAARRFQREWEGAIQDVEQEARNLNVTITGEINKTVTTTRGRLAFWVGVWNNAIQEIINLVQRAFSGIAQFIQTSLQDALALDATRVFFQGFFDDAQLGSDALRQLQRESVELGVNLVELSRGVLPFVESLEQIGDIGELARAFEIFSGRGADDFVVALKELLAGQTKSFINRFNIPPAALQDVKDLQEQFGLMEGTLIGLTEIAEDFLGEGGVQQAGESIRIAVNQVKLLGQFLKETFGEELLRQFLDLFNEFSEGLKESRPELEALAELMALLVRTVADIPFGDLDELDFGEGIDDLNDYLESIIMLADSIGILREASEAALDASLEMFLGIEGGVDKVWDLETAFTALSQIIILNARTWIELATVANHLNENLLKVGNTSLTLRDTLREAFAEGRALADEFTRDFLDTSNAIDEIRNKDRDVTVSPDITPAISGDAVDAEALAEAQEKVDDALLKNAIKNNDERIDLAIKQDRERQKLERKAQDDREKALRRHLSNLEKIQRDYEFKVSQARVQLGDDIADARLKLARAEIDIERDKANKLLEVERDLQKELQDIRDKFIREQQEAIRKRDAIRFLELERDKQEAIQEAQEDAGTTRADIQAEAEARREELQIQLQREIEDAQIANKRKLRDLQAYLQQRVAEEKIAYQRVKEELRIAEEQKRRELEISNKQQEEDLKRSQQRRLRDLKVSLDAELRLIEQHERRKLEILNKSLGEALKLRKKFLSAFKSAGDDEGESRPETITELEQGTTTNTEGGTSTTTSVTGTGGPIPLPTFPGSGTVNPDARQFGGSVTAGRIYRVNERIGGEFAAFDRNGYIIPSRSGLRVRPIPRMVGNVVHDNRSTQNNFGALTSHLSPQQIEMVAKIFGSLQNRSLRQYGV